MRRRALACLVLAVALPALAGCASTAERAARKEQAAAASDAALAAANTALDIRASDVVEATVERVLTDPTTGTTAVVVRFRSTDATRAVVWAPIDVRLLDAQGHVLARTNIPGADPALVHVPSIAPGETGFYVNDQLTPDDPAKVASARVVLGGDPVTLTAPLRNLDVLRPRIVDDPDYGWSFTATVANGTGIPQHRVIVQGIVRRKGQIVAVGTALVDTLAPGSRQDVQGFFTGSPKGGRLQVLAPASDAPGVAGAPPPDAGGGAGATSTETLP